MGKHERLTGAERMARRRAELRAQGLRVRQVWLPDLGDPTVRAEIRAEARSIACSPGHADDLALIEAVRSWPPDVG